MSKHSTLIQWSEEDEAYVAVVPELPGLSAFGSSPEEAAREMAIAKEAFLEVLVEDGEEIPKPEVLKPFSGQTRLRLPKSLHAALANQAKREDISLNTYIVQLLSQRNALAQVEKKVDRLADSVFKMALSPTPSPFDLTARSERKNFVVMTSQTEEVSAQNEDSR
ncbi:MAG: toxin-antitoxin system HicB family antitoxin [Thermodesulfobacteriota bacterium]|nr:toxin-antitoxin system HicB family antitoxin [Thermodesulfobacteriota bacterium]